MEEPKFEESYKIQTGAGYTLGIAILYNVHAKPAGSDAIARPTNVRVPKYAILNIHGAQEDMGDQCFPERSARGTNSRTVPVVASPEIPSIVPPQYGATYRANTDFANPSQAWSRVRNSEL
ncbi:unnamed protein product [Aspergillus oryzae var. brunneus]|uniref:Unnamed protein product n=2 Tax=Aspergillus oryzae TaxID=5062 RepID=A0AAN4YFR2_ASPOZ|nr:unnamed protein product [Aspergillus oryzae]GMG50339.1 unnamed protein product [Aspergillus oryzae var. brunneus]